MDVYRLRNPPTITEDELYPLHRLRALEYPPSWKDILLKRTAIPQDLAPNRSLWAGGTLRHDRLTEVELKFGNILREHFFLAAFDLEDSISIAFLTA
jgi:hypothetical protein